MPVNPELQLLADQLSAAPGPEAIFGRLGPDEPLKVAKVMYHRFAKIAHEDKYADAASKAVAHACFQRLNTLYREAQERIQDGVYGQPAPKVKIKGKRRVYEVQSALAGDVADVYVVKSGGERMIAKIAKPGNSDLMIAEASALKALAGQKLKAYFPDLIEQLRIGDRATNVLSYQDGYVPLTAVLAKYPDGLDPRHFVWIAKRLLFVLGFAHQQGLVHGAVLPEHVLIHPTTHGVQLIDWCYAVKAGEPIKALVSARRDWYPPEVLTKRPATSATDIFMAARCVRAVLGGDNKVPRRFAPLLNACQLANSARRQQDAWELQDDIAEAAKKLFGAPRYVTLDL